jgi:hypothetical protein
MYVPLEFRSQAEDNGGLLEVVLIPVCILDNDRNDILLVFPLATCMLSEPEHSPLDFAGRTGSEYRLPPSPVSHI